MDMAANIGRKAIRLVGSAVDTAILIIILLLVAVGWYAIWDSNQLFAGADAAKYEIYKPTAENEALSFKELQAINPDVFAWLTVYGTNIDYPVVQGADNYRYVSTDALGNYNLSGAIFLDIGSSKDFTDFSSILYGHHMERNTMFGEIGNFVDKAYFDARPYGMLYFDDREHGLEFFAFVHCDAYDNTVFRTGIEGLEAQQAYLDLLLDIAIHTREVRVTTQDRIVLLSTCSGSSTNGRDILVGRITDNVFADPYWTDDADGARGIREILAVDGLSGLWEQTPLWAKIMIIVFLPAVLVPIITVSIRRRKRERG